MIKSLDFETVVGNIFHIRDLSEDEYPCLEGKMTLTWQERNLCGGFKIRTTKVKAYTLDGKHYATITEDGKSLVYELE